jgi:hypothetical protein
MRILPLIAGAVMAMGGPALASTVGLNFNGPGVSGSLVLTYGAATDAKYPDAYRVTDISGTFSTSNNGIGTDSEVLGLVAVNHATPESTNLLAPNDFSRFAVASGLSPVSNGFLTYDNLFWPGGSPQTASDYPPHGGLLDIYGLMFRIGDNRVVDLWSNGDFGAGPDYGVAIATTDMALGYVAGGVTAAIAPVPLPASAWMLAGGLLALFAWRRPRTAA